MYGTNTKITQDVIDVALEKLNKGKSVTLDKWLKENATKKAKNKLRDEYDFKDNKKMLQVLADTSTWYNIVNQTTLFFKHNHKHILVFLNQLKNTCEVVEIDYNVNKEHDIWDDVEYFTEKRELENLYQINKIMNKHGFESKIVDNTIIFSKETYNCEIPISLEYNLDTIEKDIKDLGNQEDIFKNFLNGCIMPNLWKKAHLLIKDLVKLRFDILGTDEEINNNNQNDDDDEISMLYGVIHNNYNDPDYVQEKFNRDWYGMSLELSRKIRVLSWYAGIEDYEFDWLSDIEDVWNFKVENLTEIAQEGEYLGYFLDLYEKLYIFGTVYEQLKYLSEEILESDEYNDDEYYE